MLVTHLFQFLVREFPLTYAKTIEYHHKNWIKIISIIIVTGKLQKYLTK